MKIVSFVPIKLNSQRLQNKNILPLAGRPLCRHICDTLLHVKEISEHYVFCSDEKINQYLPDGFRFLQRNASLDSDFTKGLDIYTAFASHVPADIYVLAHTTSPFISSLSIQIALRRVMEGKNDSAFSAERIQSFVWYKGQPINYSLNDIPRTQDLDPIYIETSGFFIFRRDILIDHQRRIGFKPFIQEVTGKEAIDIDTKDDYDKAVLYSKMEV